MNRSDVIAFMRTEQHGCLATVSDSGTPMAAVVGYAVADSLELVFDTLGDSRKAQALRKRPHCALTMWNETQARTVQYEGVADEPKGAELDRCKQLYFATFPDGREREKWPGITWFRIKPRWVRHSDFSGDEAVITVLDL